MALKTARYLSRGASTGPLLGLLLAALSAPAIAADTHAVSVRTASRYISGSNCDPEIVGLIFPEIGQVGIVDARCSSVTTQLQTPTKAGVDDRVRVTIGGETFTACRLATYQRNHYPDTVFTAWGFECAESASR